MEVRRMPLNEPKQAASGAGACRLDRRVKPLRWLMHNMLVVHSVSACVWAFFAWAIWTH